MPQPGEWTLAEVEKLLRAAARDRRSMREVAYALQTVRAWAEANGRLRQDWAMVVVNAMRGGWGLRGYIRRFEGRKDGPVTEAQIEAELERLRGEGRG